MRATIGGAGRLLIPKALRDHLGLTQGEVEVEADGADLRVRLVVPASGTPLSDDAVRVLRDADQR